jgi:hypothetical protein
MRTILIMLILIISLNSYSQEINNKDYILKIEFKNQVDKNAKEFVQIVGKKLYHSAAHGYFYIGISKTELKSIFNLEIEVTVTKGAGNSVNRDAHSIKIKDMKKLNPKIKPFVTNLKIEDDPKFTAIDGAEEYQFNTKK